MTLSGCLKLFAELECCHTSRFALESFCAEQARECWICRDSGPEPLIYPCACRGCAWPAELGFPSLFCRTVTQSE